MAVLSAVGYAALIAFVGALALYINILIGCWAIKTVFGAIVNFFR
jgi:hypothetical protein